MKELLKLGVYTLLGTLLLSAPFAGLGMLSTHLVTEKTFWIQLIALFLSAVSLQGLWLNPSKGLCPWTYVDILPLSLLGLILLSYPYSIHPEPEKLLFIGQMVVLWYLLRQVFHEYPVLIGYFSMFFIATGLIEAIWGFRQLQGWAYSNHSLFRLTGSFFNPGPYSGYLAMIFPLCLHEWLNLKERTERTWVEQGKYYMALGVMLLILCVLPAGMSRSAWMAAAVSGIWVYGIHASWATWLKEAGQKKKMITCLVIGGLVLIMIGYVLFQLKAASANGRLLMWKISCLAIAESPVVGHGADGFVSAYGRAQEEYFANGEYSETEELVAGSPEYAFNEYLQVAVEYGIPFLFVVLLVIAFCFWRGITEKQIGICGGVISVLVFALSSYPMQIPGFAMTFYFLLAACVIGRSKVALLFFILMIALLGAYYWKNNQYKACKEWYRSKMLYNIGAYQAAKEGYEKLYPDLKTRGTFLFEYGHCLHKLKEYDNSTRLMQEAMKYTCDPMVLNIIGKNYQATGEYEEAEESLIRSTHRLPGRIYPYYLLVKLYAESEYRQPE